VGDHPIPAGLRELRGGRTRAHHHDRLPGEDDALQLSSPDVKPPPELVPGEVRFWRHFAPLLAGARMLTPADIQTLVDYCRACDQLEATLRRLRAAWRKREPPQFLIKMLDAQARGWMSSKIQLAGELGLTAIARTKTSWSGHAPPASKGPQGKLSKIADLQARARALRRPVDAK
jgi:phage terminase small subunit